MNEPDTSAAALSRAEQRFIVQMGDAGLDVFNPIEDNVIARLLVLGFLEAERIDDDNATIRLTTEGQVIAARLRVNMG